MQVFRSGPVGPARPAGSPMTQPIRGSVHPRFQTGWRFGWPAPIEPRKSEANRRCALGIRPAACAGPQARRPCDRPPVAAPPAMPENRPGRLRQGRMSWTRLADPEAGSAYVSPPLADDAFTNFNTTIPDLGDDRIVHPVGRAQLKFLPGIVEYVGRPSLGAGELGCLGYDRVQNGLQIHRRIHGLADLSERPQLVHRVAELARARLHLVEQGYVLDENQGLTRNRRDQLDLPSVKRLHDATGQDNHADGNSVP